MESLNKESIVKRWKSKTPIFWKKLQRVGILLGGIGAAILAAPITAPAALITTAGYLTLAGSLTATLSQLTVEDKEVLD